MPPRPIPPRLTPLCLAAAGTMAGVLAGFLVAGTAKAEGPGRPLLVELYTSQGCATCPPADAFFERLAERRDVIALSLHVDYWDYIGWADTFGNPAFTERQQDYAQAAGAEAVFTPQIVVEGRMGVVGSDKGAVDRALSLAFRHVPPGPKLTVRREGDRLFITAPPDPGLGDEVSVELFRYQPEATIEIGAGENEGKRVRYVNIVTGVSELARWDGDMPLELTVEVPGPRRNVVVLQDPAPGAVVAVAESP